MLFLLLVLVVFHEIHAQEEDALKLLRAAKFRLREDDLVEGERLLLSSLEKFPLGEAHGLLGLVRRNTVGPSEDFYDRVFAHFVEAVRMQHHLNRTLDQVRSKVPCEDSYHTQFGRVYRHRLRHDAEYLRFLVQEGVLGHDDVRQHIHRLEQVYLQMSEEEHFLSHSQWALIAPTYMRSFYQPPCPRLSTDALNPSHDWNSLQNAYWSANPNFIVIDNFFSPSALHALHRHALLSPFLGTRPSFVASFLVDSLGSPLLAQVIEEMRIKMPQIFCPQHRLWNAWEFKYDDRMGKAIELHADQAAVNFNVWISPDDGTASRDSGGLDVWPVVPPEDWQFEDYNNSIDREAIDKLLGNATKPHKIPFRSNRAIIFQSELIHGSQKLLWKEGYSTRRINLTLLFGKPGQSQLCRPNQE